MVLAGTAGTEEIAEQGGAFGGADTAVNLELVIEASVTAEVGDRYPVGRRTHVGLPPTPISNPGLASIEAAAHPAHVSYLYYVAGANGCGEQVFSNTSAEFEANAAAYKAAVAHNGGRPPVCKQK